MAELFIMRGWHPQSGSFAHWVTEGIYDTAGLFYTGPPRFSELVDITLADVIPIEEESILFAFRDTQDRDEDTTNHEAFTQASELDRPDAVEANGPVAVQDTLEPTQDTTADAGYVVDSRDRVDPVVTIISSTGWPLWDLHELMYDSAPYAGRIDQRLLAPSVGGTPGVSDTDDVREVLNDTNAGNSLQQSLADPPTFDLANRGLIFDSGATNRWLEIPTPDVFLAPTETARFSIAFGFNGVGLSQAVFIDTGENDGRSFVLRYNGFASDVIFTAYDSSMSPLYSLSAFVASVTGEHVIVVTSDGEVAELYYDNMETPIATTGTAGVPLSTEAGGHHGLVTVGRYEDGSGGRWDGFFQGMILDEFIWPRNVRERAKGYLQEYVKDPEDLGHPDLVDLLYVNGNIGSGFVTPAKASTTAEATSEAQTRYEPDTFVAEYDATDLSSLALNDNGTGGVPSLGGTVGRWLDQGGDSTADGRQATAADRPIRSLIHGRPSVEFVSDDWLDCQNLGWLSGVDASVVMSVVTLTTEDGDTQTVYQAETDAGSSWILLDKYLPGGVPNWRAGGRRVSGDSFGSVAKALVGESGEGYAVSLIGINDYASPAQSFRVNGVESTASPTWSAGTAEAVSSDGITIGAAGGVDGWTGHIERLVVLDSVPDDQEIRLFETSKEVFHSDEHGV